MVGVNSSSSADNWISINENLFTCSTFANFLLTFFISISIKSTTSFDLHKLSKALLIYETLSGDEIRDLILKDIKPSKSFKEDNEDDNKASSALGSLGLKPKPAI